MLKPRWRIYRFFISLLLFPLSLYASSTADITHSPGGFPSQKVIQESREEQDFNRAVTAYRFWYPTVSAEAIFNGNREIGIKDNQNIAILTTEPHHIGFTLNSDTPYAAAVLDLTKGPMVIELPPGPFVGLVNDHHQRWILDMGIPGADRGQGGKYIILPPDYKGKIPTGNFKTGNSSSYKALLALRAVPIKGDEDAMTNLRAVKVYPLASLDNPQLLTFVDASKMKMDSTPLRWEKTFKFWEVLHQIINDEPIVDEFLPMYGILATLGMEKGRPFNPDERMKAILEKAAKVGNEQMLVAAFANGRHDRTTWRDRKWEWLGLASEKANYKTLADLDTEACDRWFIQAIASSPAMFKRVPGTGSLYWLGLRDKEGAYLDGGKSYRLRIPQPVPASLLWSLTVYDAATRSQIQTDQNKAALRSLYELKNDKPQIAIDLYFGPHPPSEHDKAFWIKTLPGKNWFAYFRIYGPEQAAFDGSWKLGDFEKIK